MEANESDWSTEYLDLVLPIKIVNGVEEAILHINKYGSKHTDAILTEDKKVARLFLRMVDSSSVKSIRVNRGSLPYLSKSGLRFLVNSLAIGISHPLSGPKA
jgi:gamma-glutamyl phosphate reductase